MKLTYTVESDCLQRKGINHSGVCLHSLINNVKRDNEDINCACMSGRDLRTVHCSAEDEHTIK